MVVRRVPVIVDPYGYHDQQQDDQQERLSFVPSTPDRFYYASALGEEEEGQEPSQGQSPTPLTLPPELENLVLPKSESGSYFILFFSSSRVLGILLAPSQMAIFATSSWGMGIGAQVGFGPTNVCKIEKFCHLRRHCIHLFLLHNF